VFDAEPRRALSGFAHRPLSRFIRARQRLALPQHLNAREKSNPQGRDALRLLGFHDRPVPFLVYNCTFEAGGYEETHQKFPGWGALQKNGWRPARTTLVSPSRGSRRFASNRNRGDNFRHSCRIEPTGREDRNGVAPVSSRDERDSR